LNSSSNLLINQQISSPLSSSSPSQHQNINSRNSSSTIPNYVLQQQQQQLQQQQQAQLMANSQNGLQQQPANKPYKPYNSQIMSLDRDIQNLNINNSNIVNLNRSINSNSNLILPNYGNANSLSPLTKSMHSKYFIMF
jgi:hypothetical protein